MAELRKYGASTTIYFPLVDAGEIDFESTPVSFASGDTQISKDGGAFANTGSNPAHEGNGIYSLALTSTEMEAAVVTVTVVDQTATKAWEDQALIIDTYGNASAQHAFDLDTATQDVNVSQISGDSTAADNAESFFDGTGYAGTNNVIPTVTSVTNEVTADVTAISGDSTAADNLESQFDGTGLTGDTYPATQAQAGNIAIGTAATNTVPSGATVTTGTEVNSYTDTAALDGTVHEVNPVGGNTEFYYEFNIGANGSPVGIQWQGYANSNGDSYAVYAYNWIDTTWEQIGTIAGANGSTVVAQSFDLTTAHVGTSSNAGVVRWRVVSTDGTGFNTDRILCSFATVYQSVGYADGAIWVDTNSGNTGTEVFVDGVADKPVGSWANALTLASSLNLKRFKVVAGSSITLTGDSSEYEIIGDGLFNLNLGSQNISNAYIRKASLTGTGTGSGVIIEDSLLNDNVSIPPSYLLRCGIGSSSGNPLTASGAGEFVFVDCISVVAGSGTPYMDFSGTGSSTGVNIRRWSGGANITLDSNNTLSHEVVTGGGATVTTGGGNAEIRGIPRSVTINASAAETVQFVGVTGPITLNGTTTATINLYGVSASVTDNTSAATVTDKTVSQPNINTEADTALTDYDAPTRSELTTDINSVLTRLGTPAGADIAADIATIDGVVDDVLVDTNELQTNQGNWLTATGFSTHSAADVWSVGTRTLTSFGTLVSDIWSAVSRTLTDKTGFSISGTLTTLDALDTAQDTQHATTQADIAALSIPSAADIRTEIDNNSTQLAAIIVDTGTDIPALIAALNDLSAAQVNAEVDSALADYDPPTNTEMLAAFTEIKGATFSGVTDSLEAIRDRGDAAWVTGGGGSAPTAEEVANAVWDEAKAGHVSAGSFGEEVQSHALSSEISALNDISTAQVNAEVDAALADYDGPTKAELDSGLAGLNDISAAQVNAEVDTALTDYDGPTNAELEARTLVSADYFNPTTDTVTTVSNVTNGVTVDTNNDKTGYSLSPSGIQAIWDALTTALTTVGSIGKLFADNINATISSRSSHTANDITGGTTVATAESNIRGADGDDLKDLSDTLDSVYTGTPPTVGEIRQELDNNSTQLAAIVEDTGTTLPAQISGLNNLSAAQVNTQLLDVLNVDTFSELTGVPADDTTLTNMVRWLYMSARNKMEQTATETTLYADDGTTVVSTAVVSDNGTTLTRGEFS